MRIAVVCLLAAALALPAEAKNFGSIEVKGVGTIYVVGPDWATAHIQMSGNGFTLNGGGRVYLASKPDEGFNPDTFWQTPLMDKHFAYTLDLSRVGCKCNAAAYFINMPGAGPGEGGDWYCDANFVGGQWCPEYDTLESNKYVIAGTLHTCNGGPGNWGDCDRGGCQSNSWRNGPTLLCPEEKCTINTNKPFVVSHLQNAAIANIWMSQEGRTADFNFCSDGGYNSNMAQSYSGMVFSASLWGGNGINMDWLDGETGCYEQCNIDASSVTFSNFELW